ncbi:hypothetical protein SPHINGOT1_120389 [Sphingomonas sp. T1]|nr:hypothetical protein SPHINGOT1_120389 [Sphingomonas sp. T1]
MKGIVSQAERAAAHLGLRHLAQRGRLARSENVREVEQILVAKSIHRGLDGHEAIERARRYHPLALGSYFEHRRPLAEPVRIYRRRPH